MATTFNTIQNADAAGFLPEIWAQQALRLLRAKLRAAKLIAKHTDFEPGFRGKILNIPYPGTFRATDKLPGELATIQTPQNGGMVPLALNKHKTVDAVIEDFTQTQANSNLRLRYLNPMVVALANSIEDTVLETLVDGFSADPLGAVGTALDGAELRVVNEQFSNQLADEDGRSIIVSPAGITELLSDETLQTYFAFANADAIRNGGQSVHIYGLDILMSQRIGVVEDGASPNGTKNISTGAVSNIALAPESAVIAMVPFWTPDGTPGADITTVVDEESGLVMRLGLQYDAPRRGVYLFLDALFGVKSLRAGLGGVVLNGTAPTP